MKGYPTLQYFTASTKGATYNQARDFASMKSFINDKLSSCNLKTKKGCAQNQIEFIEKNKDKTAAEITALRKEKEAILKEVKKNRTAAQATLREQEKEWGRTERNINKAMGLIKQLEKAAKDAKPAKDEM